MAEMGLQQYLMKSNEISLNSWANTSIWMSVGRISPLVKCLRICSALVTSSVFLVPNMVVDDDAPGGVSGVVGNRWPGSMSLSFFVRILGACNAGRRFLLTFLVSMGYVDVDVVGLAGVSTILWLTSLGGDLERVEP